jgi:hypothetical protein
MGLEQEVCGACRRPRDEREIEDGREMIRRLAEKRRRRPFVIARWAAFAAVLGLAFLGRGLFFARTSALRDEFHREKENLDKQYGTSATAAPQAAAATPAAPLHLSIVPSAPVPAAPVPAAPVPARASETRAAAPSESVPDLPLPPIDLASQWVFYGRAYDLISLRPIAGAELTVAPARNDSWNATAKSDAYGRFRLILPRLPEGSWEVHGSHPNYEAPVLYEPDIPYARLPLAKRRGIVREAQDGDVPLPALTDVVGEASVRRDVFLAPRR